MNSDSLFIYATGLITHLFTHIHLLCESPFNAKSVFNSRNYLEKRFFFFDKVEKFKERC